MIIGDNHVTICATELQKNLCVTLEVLKYQVLQNQVLEWVLLQTLILYPFMCAIWDLELIFN